MTGVASERPGSAPLDFFALLQALLAHEVEFVLIGGFALVFHGRSRATKDVDIVPDPDPANLRRLWRALVSLDASPLEQGDFRPEEMPVPFTPGGLLEGGNWAIDTRFGRLDVMQSVDGVESYEDLRSRAVVDEPPELDRPICVAGRDDLVRMKLRAARPQDLIDIQALKMAEGLEE
jgi:hypothetical protein